MTLNTSNWKDVINGREKVRGKLPDAHENPDDREEACMSDLPENDPRTPEQAEADLKFVFWLAEQLNALSRRKRETCPYCGTHVDALREAGRDIYAVPCGCRICQGAVPWVWGRGQEDAGI